MPSCVVLLREQELLNCRRPFLARGSKAIRCQTCLLAQNYCICASKPEVQGKSAFLLLMYHGEVFKPSNTGRLIAEVVKDCHAFQWTRTDFDSRLLALLNDPSYQPILVFPHEYAEPERCIDSPLQLPSLANQEKTPLFVMLDGTWREAKKMFKTPYLAHLPVLGVHPQQGSRYLLREAAHLHQLCTAEVAIEALALAGDSAYSQGLAAYFELFRHHYLKMKANTAL
ncbi:MAG: DTW domain-containing protein [Venatoribacter sp.]